MVTPIRRIFVAHFASFSGVLPANTVALISAQRVAASRELGYQLTAESKSILLLQWFCVRCRGQRGLAAAETGAAVEAAGTGTGDFDFAAAALGAGEVALALGEEL